MVVASGIPYHGVTLHKSFDSVLRNFITFSDVGHDLGAIALHTGHPLFEEDVAGLVTFKGRSSIQKQAIFAGYGRKLIGRTLDVIFQFPKTLYFVT